MNEPKLTNEQGIILTGFTGKLCCSFPEFHADVERRMGRPVWTHEFADKETNEKIKELYREDFISIMPESAKTE